MQLPLVYIATSLPKMRTSSIWHRTPSRPARSSSVGSVRERSRCRKGAWLKQKRPIGVMNVVKRCEDCERGICQNPLFASSFEKTLAPANFASVSSTLGSGWTSLSTLSLSGFRSTQILTFPDFFRTTTIPAHHGVGSVTLEMMPAFSIFPSSSANLGRRGRGTLRGVKRAKSLAPGISWMVYPLKVFLGL